MRLDPARWRRHGLVLAVFVAVFLGRFAWPPMQSEAMADLDITNAQAGLFMNAFYFGYLATQLPGGLLADRFGAKLVLAASLFISGAATLMLYTIAGPGEGCFWRALAGLGGGAVYAAALKATVVSFPRREMGRACGLLMMAPTLGTLIPNLLAPRLSLALGGWRPAFLVLGGLLLGLWVLFLIRFPSRKVPVESGGAAVGGESPWTGLRLVLTDRRLRLLCLAGFGLLWSFIGFVSWSNQYMIRELGFSKLAAGQIMGAFGVAGLAATALAGVLGDRLSAKAGPWRSPEMLLAAFFGLELLGLALFPFCAGAAGLALATGLVGAGVGACSALIAMLTSAYAGPRWAATAGGATGTVFQSAGLLAPFILGLTVDVRGDYLLVWPLLIAGPAAALAALAWLVRARA